MTRSGGRVDGARLPVPRTLIRLSEMNHNSHAPIQTAAVESSIIGTQKNLRVPAR